MSRSTPTVKSARPRVPGTRAISVSGQRSTLGLLVLGAVVSATVSGMLFNAVNAAVWQGPPAGVPPANNRPAVIWNSEDSGTQQTDASLNIDGMAVFGNATAVLAPAENLIYGNISSTSTGNLLLLQVDSGDVLRVTKDGDVTFTGDVRFDGALRIAGGSPGAGKVLTSTDGAGNVTWQTLAAGVSGTGTTNYVPKFTAASTLGNSLVYDNGTRVGIGTASPSTFYKLHVYDGSAAAAAMGISSNGPSSSVVAEAAGGASIGLTAFSNAVIANIFQQSATSSTQLFASSAASKMFIGTNGAAPLVLGVNYGNSFQRSSLEIAANGNVEAGSSYKFGVRSQAGGYLLYADPSQQRIGINHPGAGQALSATLDLASSFGIEGVRIIPNNAAALNVRTGAGTELFKVDVGGDLVRLKGVTYAWPAAQGAASTVLTNNGSGTLTWATVNALPGGSVNQVAWHNGTSWVATGSPVLSGTIQATEGHLSRGLRLSNNGLGVPAYPVDIEVGSFQTAPNNTGLLSINSLSGQTVDMGLRLAVAGTTSWVIKQPSGSSDLRISYGGTDRMQILAGSGNVGIGVSPSSYRLDVAGAGHFSSYVDISNDLTVSGNVRMLGAWSATSTSLAIGLNAGAQSSQAMAIGSESTILNSANGMIFGRNISMDGSPNTTVLGSGWNTLNKPYIIGQGAAVMIYAGATAPSIFVKPATAIGSAGQVGIATTSPAAGTALDVNGTLRANGFTLPTGAAAGRILTSDALGNATWQVAAAGVSGVGSANRVALWSGASSLTDDSGLYFNGTNDHLGIGTNAPGFTLDVRNASATGLAAMNVSNENGTRLYTGYRIARGSPSTERWFLGMNNADESFRIRRNSTTDDVVIDGATGNVGIGTADPQQALDVRGNIESDGSVIATRLGIHNNATGTNIMNFQGGGTNIDAWLKFRWGGNAPRQRSGLMFSRFDDKRFYMFNNGNVTAGEIRIDYANSASEDHDVAGVNIFKLSSGGNLTITGTYSPSDRRLKENIQNFDGALAVLGKVKVRQYDLLRTGEEQVGFVAQELYEAWPEVVHVGGDDVDQDAWSINYARMTPLIIRGVQEQQEMIDALSTRLHLLEDGSASAMDARVTELEDRVDQLERELLELQMRQQQ